MSIVLRVFTLILEILIDLFNSIFKFVIYFVNFDIINLLCFLLYLLLILLILHTALSLPGNVNHAAPRSIRVPPVPGPSGRPKCGSNYQLGNGGSTGAMKVGEFHHSNNSIHLNYILNYLGSRITQVNLNKPEGHLWGNRGVKKRAQYFGWVPGWVGSQSTIG
jgi:hypothetical protein